jgi:hypothetical protein
MLWGCSPVRELYWEIGTETEILHTAAGRFGDFADTTPGPHPEPSIHTRPSQREFFVSIMKY